MRKIFYTLMLALLMVSCQGDKPLPGPEPEPNPNPGEDVVVTTFRLTLRHNMDYLRSPEWSGESVRGEVEWGDGTKEAYKEGLDHDYAADGKYSAKFEMENVEGFEIERLGDIEHFDIAL